jgi:hypothetical protein
MLVGAGLACGSRPCRRYSLHRYPILPTDKPSIAGKAGSHKPIMLIHPIPALK